MTDPAALTLADRATEIRSKNAGPFWITLEAFMSDQDGYVAAERTITTGLIARLYHVPEKHILIFRIPDLNVIKISFPRKISQASVHDRDIHAGQHHVLLAREKLF